MASIVQRNKSFCVVYTIYMLTLHASYTKVLF